MSTVAGSEQHVDVAVRRGHCERIASEAAALVRDRYRNPGEVRGKGAMDEARRYADLVTEVDELSEQLILKQIADISQEAVVLAEEGGLTSVDGVRMTGDPHTLEELWLVDPLDGTVNFAYGIPHFCVSVASWSCGRPLAGAIVDPIVRECFSFQWPQDDAPPTAFHDGVPVQLPDAQDSQETIVYVGGSGLSTLGDLATRFRSWRRLGSAALALSWVGSGRCGAYVQPGQLHPWDWAVGVPFVLAAGGVVSDGDANPWESVLAGTTGVIAASRGIHQQVLDVAVVANRSERETGHV